MVEATGRAGGLTAALGLVRPEGTVALKTTLAEPVCLDVSRVVVQEVTLVGSRCGDIGLALDHLARGLVDPRGLIEASYPLARCEEALARAARPGASKILLRVGA